MKIVGSDSRHFRPPIRAEPDRVLWQAQSTGTTKNKKERENPDGKWAGRCSDTAVFLYPVHENTVPILDLGIYMAFFSSAVSILQTLVVAIGAGLGVWGVINLMEGYGNDNPGAKSQGIKQLMSGGGVILIGTQLIPLLGGLFG